MARQTAGARRLEVSRLDNYFKRLRSVSKLLKWGPPRGRVNTIRKGLGMSAAQLARRLGVTRAALYKLEEREVSRSITIKQLDKAADALDCEVVYALIPRKSLEQTIRDQTRAKAEARLRKANLSMGLEAEGVQGKELATAVTSASTYTEALTNRLLWDD